MNSHSIALAMMELPVVSRGGRSVGLWITTEPNVPEGKEVNDIPMGSRSVKAGGERVCFDPKGKVGIERRYQGNNREYA